MKRKIFIAGMAVMLGVVTVLGCGKFAKMDIKAENSDETETILENSDETCELSLESMKNDGLLEYLNGGDVGSNEWYQDNFGKTETEQLTEEELYKIDGGDAEYWKHYDIEGNPITREEEFSTETDVEKVMKNINLYRELSNSIDAVDIYDSSELTLEILTNRNGTVIVEKTIGIVLDDEGNGKQLNPSVKNQDYIHYNNIPTGSVVLSVFVYNPDTNAEDDILIRSDFILDNVE